MATRNKIALCLEYPIEQFGGTEVLVRELIYGLAARYELTLVSDDDAESLNKSSVAGKVAGHLRWKPGEVSADNARRLAAALAAVGVGLAHFHFGGNYGWGNRYWNRCPIIFLHRRGVPCLSTNHSAFSVFDGYCGPQRSFLVKGALFGPAWVNRLRVLGKVAAEVAVSRQNCEALRRWYWPRRGKFRQHYHSRIPKARVGTDRPLSAAERARTVLCVGTIARKKGQVILARAFGAVARDFPDWKLELVGRPGEAGAAAEIQALANSAGLAGRIFLLNERSGDEVMERMRTAAIFAMPSLFEGLGLSLQEALFSGCACIGSATGGITDLIQHDATGLLTPPGDAAGLARGLRELMGDEARRERLGVAGRRSIIEKDMFAEAMAAKYDRLYQELLSAR